MAKLDIGVLVPLREEPGPEFEKVARLGLGSCQVSTWDMTKCTDETGKKLSAAREQYGIKVSTFWAGYSGPLTLERECGDDADEIADLKKCIALLEPLR
ncbi:MAG: hypothetical protein HN368_07390 [Spirochaetales bacterium]|nr:hypothetical protein [Spirochaetales bacterium]